ncbi:DUF413 domain-containing protein [Aliikangiella maris]|uniref:Macrodomain Ori protein n=2 Tax=Aliikangiella maris TaxID=3162458 RepID=A0ABV2BYN6_9GAMM
MKNRAYWCRKPFYDNKKFPYGFSRSGVFTYKESALLESKGYLFKALVEEQVADPSTDDLAFVKAIKSGEYDNCFETQVWWKYLSYQRHLISIAGSWIQSDKNMQSMNDDEFLLEDIDTSMMNKDWDDDEEDMLEAC